VDNIKRRDHVGQASEVGLRKVDSMELNRGNKGTAQPSSNRRCCSTLQD